MATWKKILIAGANATTEDITATEVTVNLANDSFAIADASDSNIIARDRITDVVAAIAGGNGLTSSSGVMSVSGLTTTEFAAATLVIESEGIANNDNDTTIATCAAIKDFVDTQVAAGYDLDVSDGSNTGAIANNETLEIGGTANEVTVTYADGSSKFTISLPNDVITQTLDLTGAGGLTLQNDETITNATNGTVLINGEVAAGTGSAAGVFKSNGSHDVTLKTGNATTGTITITDGANGNIAITPNGTGEVDISKVDIDGGAIDGTAIGANSASTGSFTTVTTSSNVTIGGNLTVNGTTTTLDTANLLVEDKIIMVANTATPTPDTGTASGIEVETSGTAAQRPRLEWTKDLGASNDGTYDGSGTAAGLTGWGLKNHQATNQALFPIAVMEMVGNDDTAPSGNSAGIGSFYFASSNIGTAAGNLYLRVL